MMSQDAPVLVQEQVLELRRVAGLEPERARRQVPVQALQQERHLLLRRRQ